MKLEDVIARVAEATVQEMPDGAPLGLAVVVQRTIEAVGLAVATDGEVYDPAPAKEPPRAPGVPQRSYRKGDFERRMRRWRR